MEQLKVKIDSLSAAYGDKMVIQEISLEVSPGEILALIGPNGAGKTTLIRVLSGLLTASAGKVTVNGRDLLHLTNRERALILAVVPQARQLGGAYTVEQAVMMGRTAHMGWLGRDSAADRQAVQQALEQTSLVEFAQRHIASLSGGEQQRVLLARALAQSTPVLLLDEPTNHLDLHHQASLLSLVKTLAKEQQLAVIMAMHDLNQVSICASRVALLVGGRLEALGSPQEVLRAETISAAYQTPVEILTHPESGAALIFPMDAPGS